jgi:hypothetical protein
VAGSARASIPRGASAERASTPAAEDLDPRAARLREARRLLGRATRASGGQRVRAAPVDGGRVLPVAAPLRSVLPGGGLRRGSTIAVRSSMSLLLALLAEASAGGAWCALVGLPAVGLVAAEEAGLALDRVALVPRPGADLVAVASALLDGLDLVAVAGVDRLRADDRRRLAARARHRGAVLIPVGRWPGADLEVGAVAGRWHGLVGGGAGRLRCRQVRVRVGGRGAAHRERAVPVLLPGPGGAVAGVGGALAGAWRSAEGPVERPAGFVEQVGPGAAREAG